MTTYSPATRRRLRHRLLAWFDQHQRDLPWRRTKDPYSVWVSEIMLQQTQVATVIPFYNRFLSRFPDPIALARADEQTVLKYWEGLGYYRRARSLHQAAKVIVAEHGGEFPDDRSAVESLPGIGRYTAGAVLSIALDQTQPILEGNTIRLHSRLAGIEDDISKSTTQKKLWQLAEEIVDPQRPGDLNQALMEVGSQVCTPKNPHCRECPVRSSCVARAIGRVDEIPFSSRKEKFVDVDEAVVLIRRNGRVLVRQCQPAERWAGLWDFPRFQIETDDPQRQLQALVKQRTGLDTQVHDSGWQIKHGVTRYRIRLACWVAGQVKGRLLAKHSELKWVTPSELAELPLSVTGRKVSDQLGELLESRSLFA